MWICSLKGFIDKEVRSIFIPKDDLVKSEYEIEIPKSKTKVAVKIIDMLGEEVLVTEEI